jgi:hypothetical protein
MPLTRNMKSKAGLSIIVLVLVLASFTLGYQSGYTRGRKPVFSLAVDSRDATQPVNAEYQPYYTKDNPIPAQIR